MVSLAFYTFNELCRLYIICKAMLCSKKEHRFYIRGDEAEYFFSGGEIIFVFRPFRYHR